MRNRWERIARAGLLLLSLAASFYALLCSIPYTWTQFILPRFYPPAVKVLLAGWGPLLLLAGIAGGAALGGRRGRAWGSACAAAGIVAFALNFPLSLEPQSPCLVWSYLAWAPWLSWEILAAGDWRSLCVASHNAAEGRRLLSLWAAAAAVWLSSLIPHATASVPAAWAAGLATSLLAATALHAGLSLISHLAHGALEMILLLATAWAALSAAVAKALLASLSWSGAGAWLWAAWTAAALLTALTSDAAALRRDDDADLAAALARPLMGPLAASPHRPWAHAAAFAAWAAVPAAVPTLLGGQDWNRLIEMSAAILAFAGAFAAASSMAWAWPQPATARLTAATVALLLCGAGWGAWYWDPRLRLEGRSISAAFDELSMAQAPLRALKLILGRRTSAEASFFKFLADNTNVPRSRPGRPARIRLVEKLSPPATRKPHVFLIVIDSLRADYLGVYNPKVSFTPAFDALASDSLVFKNAFTAYGGTGLSEPSIWSGAMLAHQQYVTPFAPMNSLEALLDHEGYSKTVTMDQVLSALLKPDAAREPLNADPGGYFSFCATLDLLSSRLPDLQASGKPLFVYTQPQDIHIAIINREGKNNVTGKSYPSFFAPYASRVERLDACFGRFIKNLKTAGLYDDSVLIVTADHGDSLGEAGRFGHAYTIYPEVIRIPLILRLPAWLKAGRAWNPEALVSSLDIAPTLYHLLGHGPPILSPLQGRPLLAPDAATLSAWSRSELVVASSYAPVYGRLTRNGRRLYIVDAVNQQRRIFDFALDYGPEGAPADPKTADENDLAIQRVIREVHALFGL